MDVKLSLPNNTIYSRLLGLPSIDDNVPGRQQIQALLERSGQYQVSIRDAFQSCRLSTAASLVRINAAKVD